MGKRDRSIERPGGVRGRTDKRGKGRLNALKRRARYRLYRNSESVRLQGPRKGKRGTRARTVGRHGSLDSLVGLLLGLSKAGSAVRALTIDDVVLRDAVKLVVLELVYSGTRGDREMSAPGSERRARLRDVCLSSSSSESLRQDNAV